MDRIGKLWVEWNTAGGRRKKHLRETLLREIWTWYHPRLQVFLSSVPTEEREDRASDILVKVFESLESYNPDYAFSTWLYRIARNDRIDRFRKKTPTLVEWQEEFHTPNTMGETPEEIILQEADKKLLAAAAAVFAVILMPGAYDTPVRQVPINRISYEELQVAIPRVVYNAALSLQEHSNKKN